MRPTPIAATDTPERPDSYTDSYFLVVPGLTYKQLSDAAAQRNMTITQLVSTALSEFLKKTEGV